MPFPVAFDVDRPIAFQRSHVFLRLGLLVVVGWLGHPMGLLWIGVPVITAALVAQKGGDRYVDGDGPTVTGVLHWIVDLLAYLALLTDQLPGEARHAARFEVERAGSPTVGSALLRIVSAIPHVIVLAILVCFGGIVWVIAAVSVLVSGSYPEGLWRFLRGLVGWEARLLAYLASLVEQYPPFSFETASMPPAAQSSS